MSPKELRMLKTVTSAADLLRADVKTIHVHMTLKGYSVGGIGDTARKVARERANEVRDRLQLARLTERVRDIAKSEDRGIVRGG